MKTNQTGRCQCGEISYSFLEDKVISAHHCHCKDCQKSTGSGKATIIILPEEKLTSKEILNILPSRVQRDHTLAEDFAQLVVPQS